MGQDRYEKLAPDDKAHAYTQHSAEKGRYSNHPCLPFVLRDSHATPNDRYCNNSHGYRGKESDIVKPAGGYRIAAIVEISKWG